MKTFYFDSKDNIYKIFQVLEKMPKKYKEITFDIDSKNEFFQNKRWLKLVLEKANEKWIKIVFVIDNQTQESFMKIFHTPYVRRKIPVFKRIVKIFTDFLENFKDNNSFYKRHYNIFKILFLWLEIWFVVFVFFLIYNLVVPKTDIYLQANVKIKHLVQKFYIYPKDRESNFDLNKRANFPYYKKSFTTNYQIKIPVSDISYMAKPSSWRIKFFNKTTEWISLKARTEMISKNWLLFRLNNWAYIPPKDENWNPWTVFVDVTAEEKNEKWELIGSAWNIWKWEELYIKKMYISMWKKQIIARAHRDFSWWETQSDWTVQLEDINLLKKMLLKKFKENIKKAIFAHIRENWNINIAIIYKDSFSYKNISYNIDSKAWEKNAFLKWDIQWDVYFKYISKQDLKNAFKDYLNDRIVSKSEFLWWDENSIQLLALTNISSWINLVTFSINALLGYDFDEDYNNVKNKIIQEVKWKDVQSAKSIILSNPTVAWVQIETSDALNKISNISSRIFLHTSK